MTNTESKIYSGLAEIPLLDIHTHMDASHIQARDIADVMLYHMVISDLYSAGCPDGARMSEDPTEEEVEYRIKRALPYHKHIENTSCYWGMKLILKDLYGWDKEVTEANWKDLNKIIKDKAKDNNWGREILKKAKIKRTCTELWRGRNHLADDLFQYSLEWAFFTRCQWGQFDTGLLELENAWNQETPGAPLPVTVDREKLNFKRTIKTIDDVDAAIRHYCERIPYDEVLSTASHMSTDIHYMEVSKEDMVKALANRGKAGAWERDVYANYISEIYFRELEKQSKKIVLQFSIGAEPLPYETGSKLKAETVFEIASLIAKHSKLNFSFFLSELNQNQAMCTLARELPNISLSGYWWHNFFPSSIRRLMTERLDMVSTSKQFGFFSDAYCADWAYAKAIIVKTQLAAVLAEKVEQGQYTEQQALSIARKILFETAQQMLGMVPN